MNLGTFTKHENGTFTGSVTTLIGSFDIEYRPIDNKTGNQPDFRIYRSGTELEVGFARNKFGSQSGKAYLDTMIDTPEFPQAIWPALVREEDGSYMLKWSRPRRQKKSGAITNAPAPAQKAAGF